MKYHLDETDEATVVDHEPHWSSLRSSLGRMRAQTVRPEPARREMPAPPRLAKGTVPPPLPPAVQGAAASLTPIVQRSAAHVTPAVQRSAASITPIGARPVVAPPAPMYMLPIYTPAESQYGLETERVAPLPMSSLRPSWESALANAWQRFAAPICGAIAGLIFIVGYLAYSSQGGHAIAASAAPVAPVVMPTEIAVAMPVENPVIEEQAAVVAQPAVSPAAIAAPTVSVVHVEKPTKRIASSKRVASSKRRPIRLNDSTPLGDLRPSRTR